MLFVSIFSHISCGIQALPQGYKNIFGLNIIFVLGSHVFDRSETGCSGISIKYQRSEFELKNAL
jgi:hypothetical protein